jgi:hypothetical protein
LWYEVLRNHSQIHASFVYANIPAALGIILAAALFAASQTGQTAMPAESRTTSAARPLRTLRWRPPPGEQAGDDEFSGAAHPNDAELTGLPAASQRWMSKLHTY